MLVHPGQFENLLDAGRGIDQAHGALAAAERLVEGKQSAEAAAVEQDGFREVNLHVFLRGRGGAARAWSRSSVELAVPNSLTPEIRSVSP